MMLPVVMEVMLHDVTCCNGGCVTCYLLNWGLSCMICCNGSMLHDVTCCNGGMLHDVTCCNGGNVT